MPSLPLFLRYDDPTDGTWEHLDFNFTSPLPPPSALKQLNVRRAIAYCTNRWALADAAYPALSDVEIDALMIDSFFPSDHWAYTQPSMTYPYNPALGQSLLDQEDWTLPVGANYRLNAAGEELALVLTTTGSDIRVAWAEVLEGQLLDCGIRLVRLHASPGWVFGYELSGYGDINGALTRRDFELAGFTWLAEPDPQLAPLYACDQVPSELNG